ncbi:PHD finger protein EHD3-like isoform X1 [Quercus lobata]|uniref:PHD finger protein EHD3 n=1 Tax=Quercus lobata TaxID=97700 RepID=A0A7N2MJQ6_QUELO|nr:PHD finger protein EHD3-like isoform X1 [Quercus lobata]
MGDEEGTSNGGGTEGTEGFHYLKSEAMNNGISIGIGNDGGECSSGGSEGLRTYKRRRHGRSSADSKDRDDERVCVEAASHLAAQTVKERCGMVKGSNSSEQVCPPMNGSDDCSQRHCRNVVLEQIYQSLSDDEGGIQRCIREALVTNREIDCMMTVKESDLCNEDRCKYSQTGWISDGSQKAANGHPGIISSGYINETDHYTITGKCQQAFLNVLISDKFSTLCKLIFENFQGIKADLFDLSTINTRMKEGAYERSPMLFSSDIQQVWRKLQGVGTEIVSLAKSLSDMSRTSYHEQVGGLVHSTYEDGKHEFFPRESDSHTKPEQTEDCGVYKVCTCRRCGGKADGRNCLVCDSCEEMYHMSCIEPAVIEIPHRSWYCAGCTARGFGSPHEDCVVCERLNAPKTPSNGDDDGISPTNEETPIELEENSNCSIDDGLQLSKSGKNFDPCKICGSKIVDGEKLKTCSHSECPNKYYHSRCLTNKQLKSYGPCWYCPSCLCRVCLMDQDDEKIVLCDGCDHAYHIYCMKPPRTMIPKGKWFCRKCDIGIQAIRKAKRAYETLEKKQKERRDGSLRAFENLGKKWNCKREEGSEKMDMLLTAAHTLNYEEKLAAVQTDLPKG